MVVHVWQNSLRNSVLLGVSFTSRFVIWDIRGCMSSMLLIFIMYPLTCRVYLLTADWEIPRISATWFCVSWWVFSSSLASVALMAGMTVFTAISQGSINWFFTVLCYEGKAYKDDVCNIYYDVCHKQLREA